MNRQKVVQLATIILVLSVTANCFAAGTGMPWESFLDKVEGSITGPFARVGGLIAIVFAGLGVAYSEGGGMMKKILCVVLGLCITFSATTFIADGYGFAAGLGF